MRLKRVGAMIRLCIATALHLNIEFNFRNIIVQLNFQHMLSMIYLM